METTRNTDGQPRHPGLVSKVFSGYRKQFGLFWRVMLPVIVLGFILHFAALSLFKLEGPTARWIFSTSEGVSMRSFFTADNFNEPSQPDHEAAATRIVMGFTASTLRIGIFWFAICPLALIVVHHARGEQITAGTTWRQTLRKTRSIIGASIIIVSVPYGLGAIIALLMITGVFQSAFPIALIATPIVAGIVWLYFQIKWSLCNQCIIVEDLTALAAVRRSSELTGGRWGQLFGTYLLATFGMMVFTSVVLGLVLLLLSGVVSEFALLREVLQSGAFFTLLFGGQIELRLAGAPIWTIGVMVTANTLIHAILAPIWALLTTHLYLDYAGNEFKETIELGNVPQAVGG